MARFSEEQIEDIVAEHLVAEHVGAKRKVQRADETLDTAADSLEAAPDVGTPDIATVRRKYIASWQDLYNDSAEANTEKTDDGIMAPEIDYSAGTGDDYEDEIVETRVSDDEDTPAKRFIVSGPDHRVIGSQG